MALYVLAIGAAVSSLGVALATWCTRLGRAVGLTVTAYVLVTVGWMFFVMAMTSPHPYGYALIAGSPIFGPIVITRQVEIATFDWVDVFGVVVWIGIYSLVAAAFLSATVATFDRCSRSDPMRAGILGGRTSSLIEHVDFDAARGLGIGRAVKRGFPALCGSSCREVRATAGFALDFRSDGFRRRSAERGDRAGLIPAIPPPPSTCRSGSESSSSLEIRLRDRSGAIPKADAKVSPLNTPSESPPRLRRRLSPRR